MSTPTTIPHEGSFLLAELFSQLRNRGFNKQSYSFTALSIKHQLFSQHLTPFQPLKISIFRHFFRILQLL